MIRRRRTVRFSTCNVTVVRASTESLELWCEVCGATVAMVTPERAAEILMTNPRAIYRQVERGELHFVEAGGGEVLICSESLRADTEG
jgi:hypothetical protein